MASLRASPTLVPGSRDFTATTMKGRCQLVPPVSQLAQGSRYCPRLSVEIGVLGVPGRADTVEELSELVRSRGVEPLRWYGVWLFVDWLEFSGAELDPSDAKQVAATAAVELEASRRDPYRQLSRVFHLVGRKGPD